MQRCSVFVGALFLLALPAVVPAQVENQPKDNVVTVVVDFKYEATPTAFQSMQLEAGRIYQASGLKLQWRKLRTLQAHEAFADLVVVRFTGACDSSTLAGIPNVDRWGPMPMAFAHSTDGEILPFASVNCDTVKFNIRTTLAREAERAADVMMGKALGRVLAHEIYHILSGSPAHGRTGVTQATLSEDQLCYFHLNLTAADIAAIQQRRIARRSRDMKHVVTAQQGEAPGEAGRTAAASFSQAP